MLILDYLSNRFQKTKANGIEPYWIQLYQGVPQGTILGPLLFNLYINDLRLKMPNDCQQVQNSDDTLIFTSNHVLLNAKNNLEKALTLIIDYYEMHSRTLNASKTEFNIFVIQTTNKKLKLGNCCTRKSESIKYLGVSIDSALTYQDEVKSILRKMACGIKTLYSLREVRSDNYKVLTLNALVISHLHYSAVLLNGIKNNLKRSLEKQLSWDVKACFHRKNYDSSLDLKVKNKILPIRHYLDQK